MRKNNVLFCIAVIVCFACACRKENPTNETPPDFASFNIGDKSYYLSSPIDSVVFKKDPQRTTIMFFQLGGDSASINVTLYDTVPCSNRGFAVLSTKGLIGQAPGANYTIHKYGPINDYIECEFNGVLQGSTIPFSANIRVKRRL